MHSGLVIDASLKVAGGSLFCLYNGGRCSVYMEKEGVRCSVYTGGGGGSLFCLYVGGFVVRNERVAVPV